MAENPSLEKDQMILQAFQRANAELSTAHGLAVAELAPARRERTELKAAVDAHSWEATGKAKEAAVYKAIRQDIQDKRGKDEASEERTCDQTGHENPKIHNL